MKALPLRPYRCQTCRARIWRVSGKPQDWLLFALSLIGLLIILALFWFFLDASQRAEAAAVRGPGTGPGLLGSLGRPGNRQ